MYVDVVKFMVFFGHHFVFFSFDPRFFLFYGKGQAFRVRVRDGRTLEVLDVTFRADSSMGQVEVW